MKKFFLLAATVLLGYQIKAQVPNWLWAESAGGKNDDYGKAVCTDASGNVYVTGYFSSDSITFGSIILTNPDSTSHLFVVKYDDAGNVLWAKRAGGTNQNGGDGICIDATGNVYVTGYFYTSITLGNTTLTTQNIVAVGIFIVKYDSSGNVLWAKGAGGKDGDWSNSISTDANANLYITGRFNSDSLTIGSTTLVNKSIQIYDDMFVAKYDSSGNAIWAKSAGGTMSDLAYGISADANGNAFVTGVFQSDTLIFGNDTLMNAGSGYFDFFITKYDSTGNVLWAKRAGEANSDEGLSVAADDSGNAFVTGYFVSSTITFGSITLTNGGGSCSLGCPDFFIAKYDSSGNVIWAKKAGGSNIGDGVSIVTDAMGNAYVTGFFGSPFIVFGNDTLTRPGIFVAKYDASGNAIWAQSAGGRHDYEWSSGICIGSGSSVYITGAFQIDSLSFGSTTLINSTGFTGYDDFFLAKLSGSVGIKEISLSSRFIIFPNPAFSQVFLQTDLPLHHASLTMENVFGQTMRQITLNGTENSIMLQWDNLPSGIYFIRLIDESGVVITTKRLIIAD